jgi:putative DNA primase/helicase
MSTLSERLELEEVPDPTLAAAAALGIKRMRRKKPAGPITEDESERFKAAVVRLEAWRAEHATLIAEAAEPATEAITAPHTATALDIDALAKELAALPVLDYERRRKDEAKRLGVRPSVLDKEVAKHRPEKVRAQAPILQAPQPWESRVDGAALAAEIAATIRRYVVMPDHGTEAVALWVLFAHAYDCFEISPILAIESPEKRCGKTTLLALVQAMAPKPLTAANMTTASVFRAVDTFRPTLVIDEADTFLTADNPELVGVLNSGHTKATAFVVRVVGDEHDVKPFTTWCPKAIALIGELPPTLQDRSIVVRMRRRQRGETVERRRADRTGPLADLCRKAARWAADNAVRLAIADPAVPDALDDRAADNWRPLVAIGELVGWGDKARAAALALSAVRGSDEDSGGVKLLSDCREVMRHAEWLTPTALLDRLLELPESPWAEWRGGKPITARGVARLLKPFDIKTEQRREGGDKARRYYRDAFADAWQRYLPPDTGLQVGHAGQP